MEQVTARRSCMRMVAMVAALASLAAVFGGGRADAGGEPSARRAPSAQGNPSPTEVPPSEGDPAARAEIPSPTASDVLLAVEPTPEGLVVLLDDGPTLGPIANLRVDGLDSRMWTGYACVTGSGRYAAVTFGPSEFVDRELLRDRGGFLAVIDLKTRQVRTVAERVALKYHSPGCGPVDEVAAVRTRGSGDTEVLRIDPSTGGVVAAQIVAASLSFPAPVGARTYAADGTRIVEVVEGSPTPAVVAEAEGQVVDVHADGRGTVRALEVVGDTVTARRIGAGGALSPAIASGRVGQLRLRSGASGIPLLVGRPTSSTPEFRVVRSDGDPDAVSLEGRITVDLGSSRRAPDQPGDGATPLIRSVRATDANGGGVRETIVDLSGAPGGVSLAANTTVPTCAVPRLDPNIQVMQPSPKQVEWAVHRAVRGEQTTSRPANWNRNGLSAYTPQGMFPTPTLSGGGRIPAQVVLGMLSQESNLWQAAKGALPGVAADPIIGSYYGVEVSGGRIVDFDYGDSDCGYGVGQVTDHMEAGDNYYSAAQKVAIATDYQANIQAAVQILSEKWNEAKAQGLVANNGNPSSVENWYFALWGYNSGIYPASGANKGVGWTNNPANSDWRFDRQWYLRGSLDDAKKPGDWPYQERVLGYAETGLYLYGERAFVPVDGALLLPSTSDPNVPDRFAFCSMAVNKCSSTHIDPGPQPVREDKSFCTDPDRLCRWNGPKTWLAGNGTPEQVSQHSSGAEPAVTSEHPAVCTPNASSFPLGGISSMPSGAKIVDDVPNTENIVGCPAKASDGTFSITYTTGGDGKRMGMIDMHQIGAGYGGHFWYNHTISPTRPNVEAVGRWTPPSSSTGWTRIVVHIPDHGADTNQARYKIWNGTKTYSRVVNQRWNQNTWVDLGVFNLGAGSSVTLSNVTDQDYDEGREIDIAWDAMAFVPSAKPAVSMVSFGDSYSAGEGVEPYERNTDVGRNTPGFKNACHRSEQAYPALVYKSLKAATAGGSTFHSAACSGAIMNDLTGDRYGWGEVPQIDQGWLDENTTHVTIGITGNDARFAKILEACILADVDQDNPCSNGGYYLEGDDEPLRVEQPKLIDAQLPRLRALITEVKALAPSARIALVGYPHVVANPSSTDCPPLQQATTTFFDTMTERLNGVIADAATSTGALYVDLQSVYETHEACNIGQGDEWINAVVLESDSGSGVNRPGSGTFHPKGSGHAAAAPEVLRVLTKGGNTDAVPFATVDAMIKQQFVDFAGRQPTSTELTAWRNDINNDIKTPEQLIDALAHGPAWAEDRAGLVRLYWAFFLRMPDTGGFKYWIGRREAGVTLSTIAANYAGSSEFATRYGAPSASAFVTLIYQNVFGRNPDPSGLAYWTKKINEGMSKGAVMVNFSESSEGIRVLAPQTDTTLVYFGMQGENMPTTATFKSWVAGLKDATPLSSYIRVHRLSATYASRF